MQLPDNFGHPPGEERHRAFRNTLIQFKKIIRSSKNVDEIEQEMQNFIDECRQMDWHAKTSEVYHKDEGEKLANKIYAELERYVMALRQKSHDAQSSDLMNALDLMEQYVKSFKVT